MYWYTHHLVCNYQETKPTLFTAYSPTYQTVDEFIRKIVKISESIHPQLGFTKNYILILLQSIFIEFRKLKIWYKI